MDAPTKCVYCDGTDPNCGFCEMGKPLDTQEDWDKTWGKILAPDDPMHGESARDYIRRMHGPSGCRCSHAYSRCRWAVRYDDLRGDHSMGHGGWGWHK